MDVSIIVFGHAAAYKTKSGISVDYFDLLREDLLKMTRGVKFERVLLSEIKEGGVVKCGAKQFLLSLLSSF